MKGYIIDKNGKWADNTASVPMQRKERMETSKAYDKVIGYIKGEIISGGLVQGQKLPPERELAQILGVGRNSVREALRALGVIGVIDSTQGAGNFVAGRFDRNLVEWMTMMYLLRQTDYRQISELRSGLELQAGSLAVARISDPAVDELARIVDELGRCHDEGRSAALDKQLHYRIAQASQNQLIMEILQALSHVMDAFIQDLRREILQALAYRDRLQAVHQNMVTALKKRDAAGLEAAYREHFGLISAALDTAGAFQK